MTWMELECIMLSEIIPVRERQKPYYFTHMWNLRNKQMNIGGGREKEDKNRNGIQSNNGQDDE